MKELDNIKAMINGDRVVHVGMSEEKFEERYGNVLGFAAASPEPCNDPYESCLIQGKGGSDNEALGAFIQDYKDQGPYKDGDIFWRVSPVMDVEIDVITLQEKYTVRARFTIRPNS